MERIAHFEGTGRVMVCLFGIRHSQGPPSAGAPEGDAPANSTLPTCFPDAKPPGSASPHCADTTQALRGHPVPAKEEMAEGTGNGTGRPLKTQSFWC